MHWVWQQAWGKGNGGVRTHKLSDTHTASFIKTINKITTIKKVSNVRNTNYNTAFIKIKSILFSSIFGS